MVGYIANKGTPNFAQNFKNSKVGLFQNVSYNNYFNLIGKIKIVLILPISNTATLS